MLPNDKGHTIRADFYKIIRTIPVTDKLIEVDVAPIITIVTIDSNCVFCLEF